MDFDNGRLCKYNSYIIVLFSNILFRKKIVETLHGIVSVPNANLVQDALVPVLVEDSDCLLLPNKYLW